MSTDDDLVTRFGELRDAEATFAPPFQHTAGAAQFRARHSRFRPRLSALAGAGIALVLAVGIVRATDRALQRRAFLGTLLSSEQWVAPTDFLLGAPGSEFLRTVPPLGSVEALVPNAIITERRSP